MGTLVSVDEGNSRFPVTAIRESSGAIHLEFNKLKIVFDGEFGGDGSEITGNWVQNQFKRQLVFKRLPQPATLPGSDQPSFKTTGELTP